jgi:hypothetical protein
VFHTPIARRCCDYRDRAGNTWAGRGARPRWLVDFAKKVNFVRTSAYEQAMTNKDKQLAESTCDEVFEINNDRQTVIHSSFEPAAGGGVQFRRTVARMGVSVLLIRFGMTTSSPNATRK